MAVHSIIEVEIKQTKMNLFCLHFNPVFSRNSLTTHVLQKYVLEKLNMYITCDVTFCLCQTSDNSKYFHHSLGLRDSEVDLYSKIKMLKKNRSSGEIGIPFFLNSDSGSFCTTSTKQPDSIS